MYEPAQERKRDKMKRNTNEMLGRWLIGLLAIMLSGCTVYQQYGQGAQTHFDFPNSNVTPLGPVKVSISGPGGLFSPPFMTSADESHLFQEAVNRVDGASLVLDYYSTFIVKEFWPVFWSRMELEGTAAKMEVGSKPLN